MNRERKVLGSAARERLTYGGERVLDLLLGSLRGVAVLPSRVIVG